ncbi:MAG TPA: AMP-binding protein [Acidimicrobiales bacterium]|nr:AMP-binding protein [Acidimicrobiales bacterium]
MADHVWKGGAQSTIPSLFDDRLAENPDGEYLDVCGTKLTASQVAGAGRRLAAALDDLGSAQHDRIATMLENSPEAVEAWAGIVLGGRIAVPVNTAYKGSYLLHQLADCGAKVVIVAKSLAPRLVEVVHELPDLDHVFILDDQATGTDDDAGRGGELPDLGRVAVHRWTDLQGVEDRQPSLVIRPSDLATFIYTGGTTGPSKGCMLTHNYHEALARQIGICWQRTAEDVVWTPLPLYHFNALTTVVVGTLLYGGRGAIYRKFSVSNFWSEMNRVGATITSTLGTMAYLLAHDPDRPEMPRSGLPEANRTLRLLGAAPMPVEVDDVIRERFGVKTFSGAYGVTEASLVSWQPPGVTNKPNAAGKINDEYFDVRIFDDDDAELPRGTDGEVVVRPKRPHVMFEGYWGRPEVTVETSRNWWYHTGDIGRIDDDGFLFFVDRKADYLRRRGENISSYEVESVLMSHGALADVAVHAVPSELTEDDLKVTATLKAGAELRPEELFSWCVERLPYFVLPRYVEFRLELPRSPVGRVLKRDLRDEGVTASTWDAEAAGVTYEKR